MADDDELMKKLGCVAWLIGSYVCLWIFQTRIAIYVTVGIGIPFICWILWMCGQEMDSSTRSTRRTPDKDFVALAVKLDNEKIQEIFDLLLGDWEITPRIECTQTFTKAYVTHDTIRYSGPNGETRQDFLDLSRTPMGNINLDSEGRSCIWEWDKAKQEIIVFGFFRLEGYTNLRIETTWCRPGASSATVDQEIELYPEPAQTASAPPIQAASAPQPGATGNFQPAVKVLVLPAWWESCMDTNGRVYYKNNYKKTTSWTPPTPEQIAFETQERRAQEGASPDDYGAPPSYYDSPPAFEA